jgi:hypothetical protein
MKGMIISKKGQQHATKERLNRQKGAIGLSESY